METKQALDAFSALSQETRLGVLRHLIQALPGSVAAGDIARDLDVPASTMSTHLAILSRAGLVTSERNGRVISYQADMEGLRELLGFLVNDCCQGKPELCGDLMKAMTPSCCP
jgi:DNA-binding transcriptional ArsR family regulator